MSSQFLNSIFYFFVPEFLFLFFLIIQFFVFFFVKLSYNENQLNFYVFVFHLCGLLLVIISSLLLLPQFNFEVTFYFFNSLLIYSRFLNILKIIFLFFLFIFYILSWFFFKKQKIDLFKYFTLVNLCVYSMFFIISSNHLLLTFLALEVQAFCFFILVAIFFNSVFAVEASVKYFIVSSFSSAWVLLGTSFL